MGSKGECYGGGPYIKGPTIAEESGLRSYVWKEKKGGGEKMILTRGKKVLWQVKKAACGCRKTITRKYEKKNLSIVPRPLKGLSLRGPSNRELTRGAEEYPTKYKSTKKVILSAPGTFSKKGGKNVTERGLTQISKEIKLGHEKKGKRPYMAKGKTTTEKTPTSTIGKKFLRKGK